MHYLCSRGIRIGRTRYEANKTDWQRLLKNAETFLNEGLPSTAQIRPDDPSEALQDLIAVHPDFERHTEENRLKQKYWAEYIVDRVHGRRIVERKRSSEKLTQRTK